MNITKKGYWLVIVLFVAGFGYLMFGKNRPQQQKLDAPVVVKRDCLKGEQEFIMDDDTMYDLLLKGKSYVAFTEWKECVHLSQGDIVLYRYSPSGDPVARRVAAVPGDKIELVRNPVRNNWFLKVNGKLYLAGDKPYGFGSIAAHPISIYEKAHKGLLDDKALVVFSHNPPGNRDSGDFGVVSIDDIVGLVSEHNNEFKQQ